MGVDERETGREIDWHHSIPLPDGSVTDGDVSLANHRRKAAFIPADLTGRTVLDVGAWDGYFSFECERRGADRVVALDANQHGRGRAGFEFAADRLDSGVTYRSGDVMTADFDGGFDVVLCFGVLYHVPDPASLLDRLFDLAGATICLETAIFPSPLGRAFRYDNRGRLSLFEDTTYFVPSLEWVERALRDRGGTIEAADVHLGHVVDRQVPDVAKALPLHRLLPNRYVCRVAVP